MALYWITPPEPMSCSGDTASNWKVFTEAYKDYTFATQLTEKAASSQVTTLKSVMGTVCKEVLKQLELTEEQLKSTDTILTMLEEHFTPETFFMNNVYFIVLSMR